MRATTSLTVAEFDELSGWFDAAWSAQRACIAGYINPCRRRSRTFRFSGEEKSAT